MNIHLHSPASATTPALPATKRESLSLAKGFGSRGGHRDPDVRDFLGLPDLIEEGKPMVTISAIEMTSSTTSFFQNIPADGSRALADKYCTVPVKIQHSPHFPFLDSSSSLKVWDGEFLSGEEPHLT